MNTRLSIILIITFLFSCKKEDIEQDLSKPDFSASPWVLNEGAFLSGNAAVDVVYGDGSTFSNAYQEINGQALGDVLQSGIRVGNLGFLVLNGSEKIEVVDGATFESKGIIQGISYPRYIHASGNGKVYISSGSLDGLINVLNEENFELITTINVGFGPEKMCSFSDKLFVCNSGGWSEDNSVSIINMNTNQEELRLELGDRPKDCACDPNGIVWVLCSGSTYYDENWNVTGHSFASLHKIDAITNDVVLSQTIGEEGDHPVQMELSPDGSEIYLSLNGIKSADTQQTPLILENFIDGNYNALNVNPADATIWLSSYTDFITPGTVYKYSSEGNQLNSWVTGIGPNSVIFPEY